MLKLYIANRNYSSWSLRPWLLMRTLGIGFDEVMIPFGEGFAAAVGAVSPAGRVPALVDGDLTVWDSLAIIEYLADRFPQAGVWPADLRQRARARAISAEMHSGFLALRGQMPMNLEVSLPDRGWNVNVQRDVDRICAIWSESLAASGGPFLFGRFCAADAFYAPIGTRFQTYGVALPPVCGDYVARIRALPAMQAWTALALEEKRFVPEDEPYRASR